MKDQMSWGQLAIPQCILPLAATAALKPESTYLKVKASVSCFQGGSVG